MCFIYWPFAVCAGGSRHRLHSGRSQSTHNNIENVFKKKSLLDSFPFPVVWLAVYIDGDLYLLLRTDRSSHYKTPCVFSFIYTNIQQEMDKKPRQCSFIYKRILHIFPFGFPIAAAPWNRFHRQYFVKRMKKKKISHLWCCMELGDAFPPPPLLSSMQLWPFNVDIHHRIGYIVVKGGGRRGHRQKNH